MGLQHLFTALTDHSMCLIAKRPAKSAAAAALPPWLRCRRCRLATGLPSTLCSPQAPVLAALSRQLLTLNTHALCTLAPALYEQTNRPALARPHPLPAPLPCLTALLTRLTLSPAPSPRSTAACPD